MLQIRRNERFIGVMIHYFSSSLKTVSGFLSYLFFLLLTIVGLLYLPQGYATQLKTPDTKIVFTNSTALVDYLSLQGATLNETIKSERVPQLFPVNTPKDLSELPTSVKTSIFISIVLTNALKANEAILHIRSKLIRLHLQEKLRHTLTKSDAEWLAGLARQYATTPDTPSLLQRVDIIPVSLTIAQAITESGWGTSRFALVGNALYGQHLPQASKGPYITSLSGNIKVAAFDSIYAATHSYIHTLNTSRAYRELRKIRNQMRSQQKDVSGYTLAQGLKHYSALGNKYIDIIQFIIRHYNLASLERVVLSQSSPPVMIRFAAPDIPKVDEPDSTSSILDFAFP